MRILHCALALIMGGLAMSPAPATATSQATDASESRLAARGGSLAYSPQAHVGGQEVRLTGSLGVSGARTIRLQQHMNRPGDQWFAVRGFTGTTASDGGFSFAVPAPAAFGIRYRVVAKGGKRLITTPPVTFDAKAQDLTMWVAGADPAGRERGLAVAGQPFTIAVDTTPKLFRRPETKGLPVFSGRPLTLQSRIDGDSWETLAASTVQPDGMGYFPGVVASAAGTVVYRVRQEEIVSGANRIGWMQTFPTYVTVHDPGAVTSAAGTGARHDGRMPAPAPVAGRRVAGAASPTASSRYGWYPALWDYSWEAGQSLTSPPDVGGVRTGTWLDYSDGAGRVSRQNGGLYLDSQRNNGGGPGDFGTTRATLVNAARPYGRWETRLRLRSAEADAADFAVLVELVPAEPADYACGKRNITLAEVAAHSSTMRFGAKMDTAQWSATRRIPSLFNSSPAVAVEVAKGHITWFWDGRAIGSVKSSAAVSDVPMTLRFSLVGDQVTERNQTGIVSDWQRGFALSSGKQVVARPRLAQTALTACES